MLLVKTNCPFVHQAVATVVVILIFMMQQDHCLLVLASCLPSNRSISGEISSMVSVLFAYLDIVEFHLLCCVLCNRAIWFSLSVCLSVYVSACLRVCLRVCLSICASVCLSVCLCVCLAACMTDRVLSTCYSISTLLAQGCCQWRSSIC